MVLGKRLIGGLYLFAEELNGGLADLVGIVVILSGHRKRADHRKELPESSTADPIDKLTPIFLKRLKSPAPRHV